MSPKLPRRRWRVIVPDAEPDVVSADFCDTSAGDLVFTEQIDGPAIKTRIYARGTWRRASLIDDDTADALSPVRTLDPKGRLKASAAKLQRTLDRLE